jgi:hypothetical protein
MPSDESECHGVVSLGVVSKVWIPTDRIERLDTRRCRLIFGSRCGLSGLDRMETETAYTVHESTATCAFETLNATRRIDVSEHIAN